MRPKAVGCHLLISKTDDKHPQIVVMLHETSQHIRQCGCCPLLNSISLLDNPLHFERRISATRLAERLLAHLIYDFNIYDGNVLIDLRLFFEISGYVAGRRARRIPRAARRCEHFIKLDGKIRSVIHFCILLSFLTVFLFILLVQNLFRFFLFSPCNLNIIRI